VAEANLRFYLGDAAADSAAATLLQAFTEFSLHITIGDCR
jgi:hypothetical protein